MKAGVLLIYVEPTPYILGLLQHLQSRWHGGLDVLFVTANASQPWRIDPGEAGAMLPPSLNGMAAELRRKFASGRYGIVHLAGWAGHAVFPLALLLAALYRLPVAVESDTPPPHAIALWKRAIKRLCYPLLFRLPSLFLPGGSRQASYLRHYGVTADRITLACMTVDVEAIRRHATARQSARSDIRHAFGLADGACVFLYVGRLEPVKGLQDLLAAFRLLASHDSALLIVGDGSELPVLQQAAATDSRLRCTGRLSGPQLLDAYVAADVFVLPSRFEPWGLVVNEAMAAGLPVIASERVGCVDDLVAAGATGLVVPAEAPEALALAMQQMLDADTRQRMSDGGKARIAGWTLAHEADIIIAGWTRLLESR